MFALLFLYQQYFPCSTPVSNVWCYSRSVVVISMTNFVCPYLELRHRLREYEAPPPQVREHSLHEPQASHRVSLSSSDRAVRELWKPGEEITRVCTWVICHGHPWAVSSLSIQTNAILSLFYIVCLHFYQDPTQHFTRLIWVIRFLSHFCNGNNPSAYSSIWVVASSV